MTTILSLGFYLWMILLILSLVFLILLLLSIFALVVFLVIRPRKTIEFLISFYRPLK